MSNHRARAGGSGDAELARSLRLTVMVLELIATLLGGLALGMWACETFRRRKHSDRESG
jgi:hypothetical protein